MTLNILASVFENFSENLLWGGFTFILGICVVFLGMIILVLAVSLLGKILTPSDKPKKEIVKSEEKVEPVKDETNDEDEIPEDVRVAIVAAITAYYLDSGSKNEFKVKRIKKR